MTSSSSRPDGGLRARLASASATRLSAALDDPALDLDGMVLLLRNRAATPEILRRIASDRRWTRAYEVKRGLAFHPATPLPIARRFLDHLYWKDLSSLAGDLRLPPPLRRAAERILLVRVAELTLGERIALARTAGPGVIPALRQSGEPKVLRALLGNPRLVEGDAASLASGSGTPPEVLRCLASHPTWGNRHAIRLGLVRNPRTPAAVSLGILEQLPRQDLLRVARDGSAPRLVRVTAERRLEGRIPSRRRAGA